MKKINVVISVCLIIGLIIFSVGASGTASTVETFVSTGNFDSLALSPASSTTFNIYPGETVTCGVYADPWPYGEAGTQVGWYLNGQSVAIGTPFYTTPSSLTVGSHSVVAYDGFAGDYVDFTVNVLPAPTPSPSPEVTPIPVDDGVIEYSYINANEAAMTIGLTMIALSSMGGVLANPGLFGRRKW